MSLQQIARRRSASPVDQEMFEGLVKSDFRQAFVWWARFTAPDSIRWENGYDGAADD
jgi:hypothetical protein